MNSLNKYWVHDLSPFLWKFPEDWGNWGPGGIRWYGISYLLGFISAYFLLMKYQRREKSPYNSSQILDLMTFQILGVLLGGRIGYVILYQSELLFQDPLIILKVWEGGMASHGGFLGVAIATLWYAKHSKQAVLPIADLIVTIVPPGLFFGRIANFINGELYGKPTNVFWSVIFPEKDSLPRHPSQLYEAFLEGIILFIILNIIIFKEKYINGMCSSLFLIFYGLFRIFSEQYREPDVHIGLLLNKVSIGTALSSIMIFIGIIFFIKINRNEFK